MTTSDLYPIPVNLAV